MTLRRREFFRDLGWIVLAFSVALVVANLVAHLLWWKILDWLSP